MNAKALTMITAATQSVLALSACGSQATMRTGQVADTQTRSSSIQVASDGGQVMFDGNGGSASIGADAARTGCRWSSTPPAPSVRRARRP